VLCEVAYTYLHILTYVLVKLHILTFENVCLPRWITTVFSAKEVEEEEGADDDDVEEDEEADDIDFFLERELRQIGVCVYVCVCVCVDGVCVYLGAVCMCVCR